MASSIPEPVATTVAAALRPEPAALAGASLLAAWDDGEGRSPLERALALLRHGYPHLDRTTIRHLSLVERDGLLLRLRAASFGPILAVRHACAACGEPMRFTLPTAALAATLEACTADTEDLAAEDLVARLRPPDSADIGAALIADDLDAARAILLDRCLDVRDTAGDRRAAGDVPAPLREEALARLAAMLEAAELRLDLACPACQRRATTVLDVACFFWDEVRHAGLRLVDEVHELAWAYGWAEAAILAMAPARRRAYLDLVRQ